MHKKISAALSGISLLMLAACGGGGSQCETCGSTAGGPQFSTITGTIVDKNHVPLAGVTVSAYYHNLHTTSTATTDVNGNYTLSGLDANNTALYTADYELYAEKNGHAFYPAVSNPAATIGRFDFDGFYRTLIRFVPPPSPSASGNNFTAYGNTDKLVSLPRTGQTVSYASGDDGAAARGVVLTGARFTDNSDGTITDRLTGLIWLKNANCLGTMNWASALSAANLLANGACGLSDGSSAGQWRMPNVNELESLVDVSQFNPAIAAGAPFSNVSLTSAYWSSTTYSAGTGNAMAIRLSDGRWINGVDSGDGSFSNTKTSSLNTLWAVKSGGAGQIQLLATGVYAAGTGKYINNGGVAAVAGDDATLQKGVPLNSPRFIDQGNGTLVDSMTGLTWLKKADCISNSSWSNALTAVNGLASGQCGLSDGSSAGQWRMPNRAEMLSLSDRAPTFPQAEYFNGQAQGSAGPVTGPVIFNHFVAFKFYWTSTTDAADPTQAWSVFSCDFGVYNIAKSDTQQYALAVR